MAQFHSKCCAFALLISLFDFGCTHRVIKRVDPAIPNADREEIVGVTTQRGEDIKFDSPGGALRNGMISARVRGGDYTINLADVNRLWVARVETSVPRTIGLAAGIAAGSIVAVVAVVVLTKQSCPFVYSWDGHQYSFDAEPYGGAITRGLERDDYSELEHLRPDHGVYRLLLTNEVDETQFTNLMELWIVDAPATARIVADEFGNLHQVIRLQAPIAATDRSGKDLLAWLRATDRLIWEPVAVAASDGAVRDEITVTFPKPENARHARLIVNAATGLWGSYMIKKMVELRGREAPAWLESLKPDSDELNALHAWIAREDIYRLNVDVEEPDGWHTRGSVPPGGPFIAEDRVVSIDTSHIQGDNVHIRLRPPLGFWALNSLAMDYDDDHEPAVTRIAPVYAKTDDGRDILADLMASDDRYYAMPSTGDRAEIHFKAPPEKPGLKRTIFLHTRGWYQLHLNTDREPDAQALDAIFNHADGAARFAIKEYATWKANQNY
jgi:hypothetical protein